MATLSLTRRNVRFDARLGAAASLVDWLDGRWALLFSHPHDFAIEGFEADRWQCIVREALVAADARPVGLLSSGPSCVSWVEQVNGENPLLVLDGPKYPEGAESRDRIEVLRRSIARMSSRFVMIVDDGLVLRRKLSYAPANPLPSVLDLITLLERLRAHVREPQRSAASSSSRVIQLSRRLRARHACG